MTHDRSIDSDPLQNLLANAFAVQESGIDPQVLASLVELEQSIDNQNLDLRAFIQRIAEHARSVAQANGTAIGSLEADELVYHAATGNAAPYAGRRVIATLTSSATSDITTEILRVEDADADPRLQASICRQFGAKSLLILPIACDHELWGVLQVFFDHPHTFAEPEVRTYHLLLELLASSLSASAESVHLEAHPGLNIDGESPSDIPGELPSLAPMPELRVAPAAFGALGEVVNLPAGGFDQQPIPHTARPASTLAWRRAWDIVVAAVAIIAVAILLLRHDHQSNTASEAPASAEPTSSDPGQLPPSGQSLAQPAHDAVSGPDAVPAPLATAASASAPALSGRVHRFGDDVTVRYFTPTPTVLRTNADGTQIRHLSDDVTIRYFNRAQRH
jgi:hypothetical protein